MIRQIKTTRWSLLALLAVALPTTLLAQSRDAREDQSRDSQARQDRQSRDQQQDRQDSARPRLQPEGWINIAADYDNDGRFDTVETIYLFDLETAQRRSQQRDQQGRNRQGERFADSRQRGGQDAEQSREQRVEGTIQETQTASLVGHEDHDCTLCHLKTSSGKMVCVYLGSQEDVEELDLEKGDQITATGPRTRINNKPAIIARRVSAGDKTITNDVPRQEPLQQFSGELSDVETKTFRGRDGKWMIARLRTNENGSQQINLGQQSKLKRLDLQEGDTIDVLARPGRINARSALIAQVIRANDKTVDVRKPTKRNLKRNRENSDRR